MLYLVIYLFEVLMLAYSEKKRWNTIITPLNVMMLPNTLAIIIAIVYSYSNQYVPNFYFPSLIVWIFGLAIFAIPSIFFSAINRRRELQIIVGNKDDFYKILNIIATICVFICFLKIGSLSNSLDQFGTDDFAGEYQTKGLFAHISTILCALFAYSVYKLDRNHLFSIIVIIGSLVGLYAVGTKSWIIAPLLIGYYGRLITGKTNFSFKNVILPLILIFGIFFLSYFLLMVVHSTSEMSFDFMKFIVEHFIDYFSGANLAFSLDYQKGIVEPQMGDALIAPLLNIVNLIFNEPYVNPINPVYWDIGDLGENNVRTVFGAFLCYSHSYFVFFIMSLSYSIITYGIYTKSRNSESLFMLMVNCTSLTFLTLSFFDFYWCNLTPYEILFLYLLMHICFSSSKGRCMKLKNNKL